MLEKQKVILLLIPNIGFGGAERVFHNHSVVLGQKFKVIECVFNKEGQQAYYSENLLLSLDVPGGQTILQKVYNFWRRVTQLRKIKRDYNIDICISHLEGADYINLLSKGKEKVILCIHGSKVHDKNISGLIGWIRKRVFMPTLYKKADKIVTVSRDINSELIKNFGVKKERIVTINNFFDIVNISIKASESISKDYENVFANGPLLITSGRLAVQKNQLPLLVIFAEVKKQKPACKLVFIGDGEMRETLVKEAFRLNLRVYQAWNNDVICDDCDVYFLGYQSNPFKYLKLADIFVFTSAWEGFPMALCEAMICGVPVITTDCPTGPREILAPHSFSEPQIEIEEYAQFGILMPLLNKSDIHKEIKVWVRTILNVLTDLNLRNSYPQKSKERMLDFTPNKIMYKWEQLIETK